MWNISKYSFVLLLSSLGALGSTNDAKAANVQNLASTPVCSLEEQGFSNESVGANTPQSTDGRLKDAPLLQWDDSTTITRAPQGVEFNDSKREALNRLLGNRSIPLLAGVSVSANLAGAFLNTFTSSGTYEGALRLNFRNKYFPIIELGIGAANQTSETTQLNYITRAPFGRIGLDYNLKRDKRSTNRIFVGARYGFSAFNYDLSGTPVQDTHWKTEAPFQFNNISDKVHWGELVFGLETSIWKFIHLGWSLRYQVRLYEHNTNIGRAWHVPGFGRNSENSHFSGTFQLIFDLTHFKKAKAPSINSSK